MYMYIMYMRYVPVYVSINFNVILIVTFLMDKSYVTCVFLQQDQNKLHAKTKCGIYSIL